MQNTPSSPQNTTSENKDTASSKQSTTSSKQEQTIDKTKYFVPVKYSLQDKVSFLTIEEFEKIRDQFEDKACCIDENTSPGYYHKNARKEKDTPSSKQSTTSSFKNHCFKELVDLCASNKLYHLKCRGETPGDLLCGLEILRKEGYKLCYIKMITISCMFADLEIMTDIPCNKVQEVWDDYMNDPDERWVKEIHRMIQTLKPFAEYTGEIDNSFYEK